MSYLLLHAVFVDLEISRAEIGDRRSILVENEHVHEYRAYVGAKSRDVLVLGLRPRDAEGDGEECKQSEG